MHLQNDDMIKTALKNGVIEVRTKIPLIYSCLVCNTPLSGNAPAKQHLESSKHKQRTIDFVSVSITNIKIGWNCL